MVAVVLLGGTDVALRLVVEVVVVAVDVTLVLDDAVTVVVVLASVVVLVAATVVVVVVPASVVVRLACGCVGVSVRVPGSERVPVFAWRNTRGAVPVRDAETV
jgi:hypothetical protein